MRFNPDTISCGVLKVFDLERDLKDFFYGYAEAADGTPYVYVLFSDNIKAGNGRWLAKRLEEFGKITKFGPKKNPNTKRQIELFVWEPSLAASKKIIKDYNKAIEGERVW
jgi:hypothetical protein